MDEGYATKGDLNRVEDKVDAMGQTLTQVSLDMRTITEQLKARDTMEKHNQIFLAEINAVRAKASEEKNTNQEAWNTLKSRALWTVMIVLLLVSFPGLVNLIRQVRGIVP